MAQLAISVSQQLFFKEIEAYPVLTREQETELTVKVYEENDAQAAKKLINSNLRFVIKIAKEYLTYGFPLMDLVQEGTIGMMTAVKKFNPYKGNRLITYAVWWIRAKIQSYIMSSWSMVKIGTTQSQRKLFQKLSKAKQELNIQGENLGEEELTKLADKLDVGLQEIIDITTRTTHRDKSLDDLAEAEGKTTYLDRVEDSDPSQEEVVYEAEYADITEKALDDGFEVLNPRERYIVEKRFYNDPPALLRELSEEFGVSKERIRQIEANALLKLRKSINQSFENFNIPLGIAG